jgi:hypothetical protein
LRSKDQVKNKPPNRNEGHPGKTTSSHSSHLTIMILRGVGKPISFKVSPVIVICTSLFLISYMITSIIIFKYYFDERRTNREQASEIERLQHESDEAQRALYRSGQHLALLEDHIKDLREGREKQEKPRGAGNVPQPVNQEKATPPAVTAAVEEADKAFQETRAGINDPTVMHDDTSLTVSFKLVNLGTGVEPLSGYVHIIALKKDPNPPQPWPNPKAVLKNGIPLDYRQGRHFSIKRYKTIRGEYFFDSKAETPSAVKVLVYDESGELILEKQLDVKGLE